MEFKKLTPNLVVRDVEANLTFYRSVLGFKLGFTVPDEPPYVFGSVTSGGVEIFLQRPESRARRVPCTRLEADRRQSHPLHRSRGHR